MRTPFCGISFVNCSFVLPAAILGLFSLPFGKKLLISQFISKEKTWIKY